MGLRFCSLASGSSGNCQFIASEEAQILLDVGLAGKRIVECMESIGEQAERIQGILVSHEHSDHIRGIGILSRRFNLPIYANNNTWEEISGKIGMIREENKRTFTTGETFSIGDIKIKSYAIAHDAAEPVAFSFQHEGAKISIATDLGHVDEKIMEELRDADLLMLESNHDIEMLKMGKYPWFLKQRILGDHGHLSNETAGHVIADLLEDQGRVSNVLLGHLSKENNFPELAYETVKTILEARNIKIGLDINIDLTYRDRVSRVYNIYK